MTCSRSLALLQCEDRLHRVNRTQTRDAARTLRRGRKLSGGMPGCAPGKGEHIYLFTPRIFCYTPAP
jgi:hypothetical protein